MIFAIGVPMLGSPELFIGFAIVVIVAFAVIPWLADHDSGKGQGLTEYALILALVVIVAVVLLAFLGQQIQQVLSNVGCALPPGCASP